MRLFAAEGYTDDSIIMVCGLERTMRALRLWNQLMAESQLKLAIPEKRFLGTWGVWLGILFFSALGLMTVPRQKLLRANAEVKRALRGELDFAEWRSLVGLLELSLRQFGAEVDDARTLQTAPAGGRGRPIHSDCA